jgi:hypothetical protein
VSRYQKQKLKAVSMNKTKLFNYLIFKFIYSFRKMTYESVRYSLPLS